MNTIKLICFPYAGGASIVYNAWKKYLDKTITMVPIELAGRGKRCNEVFFDSFESAFNNLFHDIETDIYNSSYAIFGHSMGSLFAFELAHRIKKEGYKSPLHLFLSGKYPPHIPQENSDTHHLSDERFQYEIQKLGGTKNELFLHKELFDTFAPVIRADLKLVESYRYIPNRPKLDCDFAILWGREEEGIDASKMSEWGIHTTGMCRSYEFEGGHFFINDEIVRLTNIINRTLT